MHLFDKLIFFFNKQDVYIGYSIEEVAKVINIFKENDIKYAYKLTKHLSDSDMISFERVGMNMDYDAQYTISVKERDYEEAKYLVNKVLHEKIIK